MTFLVNIRERRQITLPGAVLLKLGLSVGDNLALNVENDRLVAKPAKKQALDTLKAIQKIFGSSKISEKELQKSGRAIREKLSSELYEED